MSHSITNYSATNDHGDNGLTIIQLLQQETGWQKKHQTDKIMINKIKRWKQLTCKGDTTRQRASAFPCLSLSPNPLLYPI
jgi:hypothetical protein